MTVQSSSTLMAIHTRLIKLAGNVVTLQIAMCNSTSLANKRMSTRYCIEQASGLSEKQH